MKKNKYSCPVCGADLDKNNCCLTCQRNFTADILHHKKTGKPTLDQETVRNSLDDKLTGLLKHYVAQNDITGQSIAELRKKFLDMLSSHYRLPSYDIYPQVIKPKDKKRTPSPSRKLARITAAPSQVIELAFLLKDQVPADGKHYDGDLAATVRIINNQIEIEIPDVETYNEAPGNAIPILIEQANGKLHLVAWDNEKEDPFIDVLWPRTLRTHQALAKARSDAASTTRKNTAI